MLRGLLPRLLLIADGFTDPAVAERTLRATASGVRWVQLRDHGAPDVAFSEAAGRLVDLMRAQNPDVLVSINTRIDVAERLGCAVHVGVRGPSVADARSLLQAGVPVGRSIHAMDELSDGDPDYVIWSPVFATTSKPGAVVSGIEGLSGVCRAATSIPVIAMGGITVQRVAACWKAGAHGIAVLSGILDAENTHDAVVEYLEALETAEA